MDLLPKFGLISEYYALAKYLHYVKLQSVQLSECCTVQRLWLVRGHRSKIWNWLTTVFFNVLLQSFWHNLFNPGFVFNYTHTDYRKKALKTPFVNINLDQSSPKLNFGFTNCAWFHMTSKLSHNLTEKYKANSLALLFLLIDATFCELAIEHQVIHFHQSSSSPLLLWHSWMVFNAHLNPHWIIKKNYLPFYYSYICKVTFYFFLIRHELYLM